MMPCPYITQQGKQSTFDLDEVIDIIRGRSTKRAGWTALIVYDVNSKKFIELRDSPQDLRGNSKDEAEEVTIDYIAREFGLNSAALREIADNPRGWVFIDRML